MARFRPKYRCNIEARRHQHHQWWEEIIAENKKIDAKNSEDLQRETDIKKQNPEEEDLNV